MLALTCFSGGRERMKSRMSSWASFFTRGGMSPSTWERAEGPRAASAPGPAGHGAPRRGDQHEGSPAVLTMTLRSL